MLINNKEKNAIDENTVSAKNQLSKDKIVFGTSGQNSDLRILFVGNSITRHGPMPSIGWLGDWGMAASSQNHDYVHQTVSLVQETYPNAVYMAIQVAAWEREYWKEKTELEDIFQQALDFKPDIIVMKIGENCSREFCEQYPFDLYFHKLIDRIKTSDSKVIVGTSFWKAGEIDDKMRKAAQTNGYSLVELGDLGDNDIYMAKGEYEHSGVAAHPSDFGMRTIAERFTEEIFKILPKNL